MHRDRHCIGPLYRPTWSETVFLAVNAAAGATEGAVSRVLNGPFLVHSLHLDAQVASEGQCLTIIGCGNRSEEPTNFDHIEQNFVSDGSLVGTPEIPAFMIQRNSHYYPVNVRFPGNTTRILMIATNQGSSAASITATVFLTHLAPTDDPPLPYAA